MGWTKEKGLGANEDGQKEFITLRYKNNNNGMGFQERDNQWTEHEGKFNELLQNLGETGTQEERKIESLEEKSKSSRARVHYKKFTRGKDLSKVSAKDLANIFGKKSLDEKPEEKIEKRSDQDGESLGHGVETYHSTLSSYDYFKNKLGKIFNKKKEVTEVGTQDATEVVDTEPVVKESKKKRRKREESTIEDEPVEVTGTKKRKEEDIPEQQVVPQSNEEAPKKKKKKSKNKNIQHIEEKPNSEEQNTETTILLEDSIIEIDDVDENRGGVSKETVPKRKNKSKKSKTIEEPTEIIVLDTPKATKSIVRSATEIVDDEDCQIIEAPKKKKKKVKFDKVDEPVESTEEKNTQPKNE